jgi:hypothetical protein
MNNSKFSPRQMKFLELYFGGALMKDAARAAGYQGASDQALCTTARRILDKFSRTNRDPFGQAGALSKKISELIVSMDDNGKSEKEKLKAMKMLAALL